MADMVLQVLVSPLLGTVFNNLSSLIQSELSQILGVKKELEKLSRTVSTIQDVMEDAEDKQLHEDNKPLKNWLKRLKEAVYDAEDVLEEFAIEDALRRDRRLEVNEAANCNMTCSNNIQVLITDSVSCFDFKRVLFRRKIAKKIKDLREKFDDIAEYKSKFLLNLNSVKKDVRFVQTSSIPIEEQVYGRDKDLEKLVNLLLKNDNIDLDGDVRQGGRDVLSVCTIQGMGGLGKTTLARMVYNDVKIVEHFEFRCWVCVSENFDPITLLKAIIGSSGGRSTLDLNDLDPLQRRLQEKLSGKRFLMVLDDVWNEDQAKWDILKSSLRCADKGSSIIVTTRLKTVASIMGTLHLYSPKVLSDDDCWSLFKNRAFGDTDNEVNHHPNLEAIGKEIVKKCKGVPLAAKALGGLLRFKREESQWIHVKDSEIWNLPQHTQDAILPALRLSYNHLPSQLKQCFAYCSIFPKNYLICKNKLINLWMANGFIQSKGESMELEDVGNEIFNDLLWRSFFQAPDENEEDDIQLYQMHDLVHDLACSIMRDECLVIKVGSKATVDVGRKSSTSTATTTRHLSFHSYSSYSPSNLLDKSSFPENSTHLRTLILLRFESIKLVSSLHQLIFSNLKLLRILDLSKSGIQTVPDSICNLKHLRYLDLSNTEINSLPNEPFCSLRNLQILILSECCKLQMLPVDLNKMSSLRLLNISRCSALSQMPMEMGKLTCLRSLSNFIVGSETGYGIEELQGLQHLKGYLQIKAIEHVRSLTDAEKANLMGKRNLTSLELCWSQNNSTIKEDDDLLFGVIEGLKPHPNLKNLFIEGYQGAKFPSWMMGSYSSYLPNLVRISLVGCRSCEHLPSLGELPFLRLLEISQMESVKCIGDEFYHGDNHQYHSQGNDQRCYFPSLESLWIHDMRNLEEWSSSSSTLLLFPCLKILKIVQCVKLKSFPLLPSSLQDLHLRRCHEMLLTRLFESVLPSLKSLRIHGFDEWIPCFPLEEAGMMMMMMKLKNLTSLESLYIGSCPKLRTLPKMLMVNLSALSEFTIRNCRNLMCLPDEGMQNLNSLEHFEIWGCNSLKSLQEGLLHLTSLKKLGISYCPQLEFLPGDFQGLVALQNLSLLGLPKMTSLPTLNSQRLRSTLQSLYIHSCPSLKNLPGWVTDLATLQRLYIMNCENLKVLLPVEGLQRMTSLNFLEIRRCHPDLHKQCENYKRDNLHQIAHINTFFNEP